ncbi:MAG: hypothetical protein FJ102_09660 [Deltaproteobacteria bacterium]|nr:hypothetical protein [Deltaproteobacteria bacterium]
MFLLVAAALAAPALETETIDAALGASPTLVHASGQWWLYACSGNAVHLWTSTDARSWTDEGVALSPGDDIDAGGTCPASVLANAGIDGHDWGMWYQASGTDGVQRIALAVSDDGRTWTRAGVAYDCGGGACGSPVAMRVGKYHLWVHTEGNDEEGIRFRVHKSEDGTTWSGGIPFTFPAGETEVDLAYKGGGYRVLASGPEGTVLYEGPEIEDPLTTVARVDGCAEASVALARDPDGIIDNTADFLGIATGENPALLTALGTEEAEPCDTGEGQDSDDPDDTGDGGDGGDGDCEGCGGSAAGLPALLLWGRRRRGERRS